MAETIILIACLLLTWVLSGTLVMLGFFDPKNPIFVRVEKKYGMERNYARLVFFSWPYALLLMAKEYWIARRLLRAEKDAAYRHHLALSDAQKAQKELKRLDLESKKLQALLEENTRKQEETKKRIEIPTYRIAIPEVDGEEDLADKASNDNRRTGT